MPELARPANSLPHKPTSRPPRALSASFTTPGRPDRRVVDTGRPSRLRPASPLRREAESTPCTSSERGPPPRRPRPRPPPPGPAPRGILSDRRAVRELRRRRLHQTVRPEATLRRRRRQDRAGNPSRSWTRSYRCAGSLAYQARGPHTECLYRTSTSRPPS